MDKNQSLRYDLIEAWNRYADGSYTCDDLALVLDSIMDDDHLQEFREVFDKEWNSVPPTSEEQKEAYRKEFVQLLAKYKSKQKSRTIRISSRNNMVRLRKIWYAAAAVLLLGLLIPAVNLYIKPQAEQTVQYVETVTQRGEIKTVLLPDGTEVTLNAGSRIKYPENFTDDERSVELHGEALFDVTPDPDRPFTVKTENMNIKVTGTVFDVKDYADDLLSSVSVASGKVEVETRHATSHTRHATPILLGQNQQIKMDKVSGNVETMTFDADKYMSWTTGTLYFDGTPIREVVNMLNRLFPHVDIELADSEYSYLIMGKHKSMYIEDILKSIVYSTDLKCKKRGDKYILYNEE